MARVIVFTKAYNAEKTLPYAIDSILNQTHDNFIYYILDNGSTDKTSDIIASYLQRDSRIISLHNEVNGVGWNSLEIVKMLCNKYSESDYFCNLDADDEYYLDFIKVMLSFIEHYDLDIAACGYDLIDAQTKRIYGKYVLKEDLILENVEAFSDYFSIYHKFMRTLWGKVIPLSVLRKCSFDRALSVSYGIDTIMVMEAFSHANRAGVLAQSLHKYYVSPKSISYRLDSKRIASDHIMDDLTRTFLIGKCGSITQRNDDFLHTVYFNAIKDTITIIINTQIIFAEKMADLQEIFLLRHTQRLISWPGLKDEKGQLFGFVANWILSQGGSRKQKGAKIAAEIFLAIYPGISNLVTNETMEYLLMKIPDMPAYILLNDYNKIIERLNKWFKRHEQDDIVLTKLEIATYYASKKPDNEIFDLLVIIKNKRPKASTQINVNMLIGKILARYPLLQNVSISLGCALRNVVTLILKGDFISSLKKLISISHSIEISDNDVETYILLGQNLSAAAEDAGVYIYFKKLWISYLLDSSRWQEAKQEIDDYEQLLPGDLDFAELREKLISLQEQN